MGRSRSAQRANHFRNYPKHGDGFRRRRGRFRAVHRGQQRRAGSERELRELRGQPRSGRKCLLQLAVAAGSGRRHHGGYFGGRQRLSRMRPWLASGEPERSDARTGCQRICNDANNQASFWTTANTSTTPPVPASALGYIPETTWNDSCAGKVPNTCTTVNSNGVDLVAGSGGSSAVYTGSSNPSLKPSWQTGFGDANRDIPDVSLVSSDGFNK